MSSVSKKAKKELKIEKRFFLNTLLAVDHILDDINVIEEDITEYKKFYKAHIFSMKRKVLLACFIQWKKHFENNISILLQLLAEELDTLGDDFPEKFMEDVNHCARILENLLGTHPLTKETFEYFQKHSKKIIWGQWTGDIPNYNIINFIWKPLDYIVKNDTKENIRNEEIQKELNERIKKIIVEIPGVRSIFNTIKQRMYFERWLAVKDIGIIRQHLANKDLKDRKDIYIAEVKTILESQKGTDIRVKYNPTQSVKYPLPEGEMKPYVLVFELEIFGGSMPGSRLVIYYDAKLSEYRALLLGEWIPDDYARELIWKLRSDDIDVFFRLMQKNGLKIRGNEKRVMVGDKVISRSFSKV